MKTLAVNPSEYFKRLNPLYYLQLRVTQIIPHLILSAYSMLAVVPILMILFNSLKNRKAIFSHPFQLPNSETFSLIGYETVFSRSNFVQNFTNSLIVTGVSLIFILLIGSMAAFALSEYNFRGNSLVSLYLSIGIMIPIRLGTVSLLRLMVKLNLVNTLAGLILVYIAQGLPLTIFILSQFMRQVPKELKDAARIDGANEYHIYLMVCP